MTMTLAEIRAASVEQLANERQNAADVAETTPPVITPAIIAFADSLGTEKAQFISVIPNPYGLYGWCSDGVREKVKHDGGRCIFGWSIWEWPNVLLTAEFHSVWEDSNGDRFDITPKPRNESQIFFAADPSYAQDFDFDLRPRNRRARIYLGTHLGDVAAAAKKGFTDGQRKYEEKRAQKAGMSLNDWLIAKVALDPLAKLIDDIIDACDEFEEHFDLLGTAGTVAVDAKFRALAIRRLNLQQQLKRELKGR